jgi:hypothetical protein
MGLIYIYSNTPRSLNYRRSGVRLNTIKRIHIRAPPQTQLATGDVEAGAEVGEGRRREALGEDVCELGGSRYVKDPHLADGNPITDEVKVDLHMLGPLVLHGVGGEVDRTDVVAVRDENGSDTDGYH